MQRKTLKKVNPFPGYVRVSEPDKEELARLTALAKGENRSLREFALACGVSTSTLSRIINMKSDSDTPNSDSLIASIAENADPDSGVTLGMLLDAHGIAPMMLAPIESGEVGSSVVISSNKSISNDIVRMDGTKISGAKNCSLRENLCREILQNELISRGFELSVETRKNIVFSTDKLRYVADFVFETNALKDKGISTWAFDVHNGVMRPLMHKLSWVFGMTYLDPLRKKEMKFSLITTEEKAFEDAKGRFLDVCVPDLISIIYIDINNRKVVDEFIIPSMYDSSSVFSKKEGE
ncbi:MAG: hypothetical protein ACI4ES_06790 [Roseburia sp.]